MNAIITLSHGTAIQAISAADSYAITLARMAFAREHDIPPDEVNLNIEHAAGLLEQAPTAEDLLIINGV